MGIFFGSILVAYGGAPEVEGRIERKSVLHVFGALLASIVPELALQLGHGKSTKLLSLDGLLAECFSRVGLAERWSCELANSTTLVAIELLTGALGELLEVSSTFEIVVLDDEIMKVP